MGSIRGGNIFWPQFAYSGHIKSVLETDRYMNVEVHGIS